MQAYEDLLFGKALDAGYYVLQNARDDYRHACGLSGMHRDLVIQYIEVCSLQALPSGCTDSVPILQASAHSIIYSQSTSLHMLKAKAFGIMSTLCALLSMLVCISGIPLMLSMGSSRPPAIAI